jgi:hypothetical protein
MPVHDWTRVISGVFHHFHQDWITKITAAMNGGVLPEGYYALSEQVAEGPHPDVVTLESSEIDGRPRFAHSTSDSALAVLDHPPRVAYTEEVEREIYARSADRVAVYHASGDRVVAFIEIVSPGNKHSPYELKKFLDKLNDALDRGLHLLVIDVHPPGKHDPRGMHAAFWSLRSAEAHGVDSAQPLGLSAYRSDLAPTAYFQPLAVGNPLPEMPIFLTPDRYVNVPLETTYAESWQGVPGRWKTVIEGTGK